MESLVFNTMISRFNHHNCAKYFYIMNKNKYSFDEISGKWYKLNANNSWCEYSNMPESIKIDIVNLLTSKLNKYLITLNEIYSKLTEVYKIDKLTKKINLINKHITNIGNIGYINGITSLLSSFYINNDFKNNLNKYRNLLAFNNCIFDLDTKTFRNIEFDDYISVTTGYDYYHENVKPTKIKEVEGFLKSMFDSNINIDDTDKYISDYQYLLNIISSTLYGENRLQKFYIWTGNGSNGKTILNNLINIVFGDYFKCISVEFYTRPNKDAGDANPELADKKYCRILSSSEPEYNEKMKASKFKNISGGDLIQMRGIYEKVQYFLPHFTPIIITSNIPDLTKIDDGITRRLDVVEFKYKFVDKPKLPNERKCDSLITNKIKEDIEFRNAFIWLLIENFKQLNFDDFKKSKNSEEITKTHIIDNNPVFEYITEYCNCSPEYSIKSNDLYTDYNSKAIIKLSIIKFTELMKYLGYAKKHGKYGNYWIGLDLKTHN
jgi:P4 family phage/plasmid primase-like protien